jgi:hypothetical protein
MRAAAEAPMRPIVAPLVLVFRGRRRFLRRWLAVWLGRGQRRPAFPRRLIVGRFLPGPSF